MARKPDFVVDINILDGPLFAYKMDKGKGWSLSKPRKDQDGEQRWYNCGAMFRTKSSTADTEDDEDWDE